MEQVYRQSMRKDTRRDTNALVEVGYAGVETMHSRAHRRKSSTQKFYEKNKEIVWMAGILLSVFLISNLITGLVVRNKVKTRLEAEYQKALQAEISYARTEIETEVRSTYGADEVDAKAASIEMEAQMLAKMLYPFRDNTDEGMKSAVWCVLCRVSNRSYPNTVEDVLTQKDQWMGFSEDNPVVQRLLDIAKEQLSIYYSGSALPMSPEYVFMSWSSNEIILRTTFDGKGGCHYWYESDWK